MATTELERQALADARRASQVTVTTPIGMLAVAEHMIDQRLPAPISINRPHVGDREVHVFVHSGDFAAWTASVTVDESEECAVGARGRTHHTLHARLPNGVRVSLSTIVGAAWIGGYSDDVDPDAQPDGPVEPLGPGALAVAREHAFGQPEGSL